MSLTNFSRQGHFPSNFARPSEGALKIGGEGQTERKCFDPMVAYLTLVMIVIMSFNVWTIIVAQRARVMNEGDVFK